MKINVIVPVICAVILGYICASFIFNEYGVNSMVYSEKNNIYLLQCGAYTDKNAIKDIKGIDTKITIKNKDKYYSYIGMTSSKKIAEEIKKMYKEKGLDIYIKEDYLDNKDFMNQLTQYDVLLNSSKTLEEVNSVLKTVLATYDELVLNP